MCEVHEQRSVVMNNGLLFVNFGVFLNGNAAKKIKAEKLQTENLSLRLIIWWAFFKFERAKPSDYNDLKRT